MYFHKLALEYNRHELGRTSNPYSQNETVMMNIFNNHIKEYFYKWQIKSITPKVLKKFLQKKEAEVGAPSLNKIINYFSRVFQYAIDEEYIEFSPASGLKRYPEQSRNIYASKEELEKINAYLKEKWKIPSNRQSIVYIYILMATGARPSALLRVYRKDFRFVDTDQGKACVAFFKGKNFNTTGEMDRIIIPPAVFKMWEDHVEKDYPTVETMFYMKGYPKQFWHGMRKKLGMEHLALRDLRRTFATIGLGEGVGIDQLGELLNHKSVQTTKIYAKLDQSKAIESIKIIGGKLEEMGLPS